MAGPGDFYTEEEQRRAMAEALGLRRQQALGLAAQLAGGRTAPRLGASLLEGAETQRRLIQQRQLALAESKQRAEAQAAAAQRSAIDDDRAERALREQMRHNAFSERNPAATIVAGPGGALFAVNPRDPSGGAQPVMAGGGQLRRPKDLSEGQRKDMQTVAAEAEAAQRLRQGFRDDFAGAGPLGSAGVAVSRMAGSLGTEGMQQEADWWAEYERALNIPARNLVFGASLSEGERKAWDSARNIKPGMAPERIRGNLAELERLKRVGLERMQKQAVASGVANEEVQALAPAPATTNRDAQALNWARSNAGDPRAKKILERLGVSE